MALNAAASDRAPLLISLGVLLVVAVLVEAVAVRPLRGASPLAKLVATRAQLVADPFLVGKQMIEIAAAEIGTPRDLRGALVWTQVRPGRPFAPPRPREGWEGSRG